MEAGAAAAHVTECGSAFRWKGEVWHKDEWRVDVCCRSGQRGDIARAIAGVHDYEMPAITA